MTKENEVIADSKIFTLRKPVKLNDGNTVTAVSLKEPTVQQLEMAEKLSSQENKGTPTANGLAVHLIALVSGIHAQTVRAIFSRDYMEMRDYMNSFLVPSPEGEKSEIK